MKKSLLKVVMGSIAVSMMGLSMPSFADVTQADVERFVTKYDVNKDGMISRVEVMKMAAEMFEKMDTGKKGMLDDKKAMAFLLELQKSDGAPSGYMISKADMMKKIETAFDKLDAAKKQMLNKKQTEALLRELMKSGA
jgi:Ca2+-binding EF-hand superfamily protein